MKRNFIVVVVCIVIVLVIGLPIAKYFNIKGSGAGTAEVAKEAEYCIFIEIEDKILYLLQDGKCIREYPVATGMPYLPSPIGFWKIVEKGDWGEGFGGRWLGLNVPWGTFHQEHIYNPLFEGVLELVGYPYAIVFKDFNLVNQLLQ